METKIIFHKGDELSLIGNGSASFAYKAKTVETRPLTAELSRSLDERTLQNLKNSDSIIVALTQQGYAYNAKVSEIGQDKRVVLSLSERHETRNFFRVNTILSMGYEIVKLAPGAGHVEDEIDLGEIRGLVNDGQATKTEKLLGEMLFNILTEIRTLRKQTQKSNQYDTTQIIPRLMSVSGSGIRFNSNVEHNRNDLLRLHIILPNRDMPVTALVKVIRVEAELSSGEDRVYSVACQFKEINDADQERIMRFVFQSQRKKASRKSAIAI